jgi:hypothetical protein
MEETKGGDGADMFKPFPLLEGVPIEENPLTLRAVLIGIILGSLVNASNVYLGEQTPLPDCWHTPSN